MKFEQKQRNCNRVIMFLNQIFQEDSLYELYSWFLKKQKNLLGLFDNDQKLKKFFTLCKSSSSFSKKEDFLFHKDSKLILPNLLNSFDLIACDKKRQRVLAMLVNMFITFHKIHKKSQYFCRDINATESKFRTILLIKR